MNVNSSVQSSYQTQPQNGYGAQSKSADSQISALLNANSAPLDKVAFSDAAMKTSQKAASQSQLQSQSNSSAADTKDFQSILMKSMLSAYGVSNAVTNNLSLRA
jgi:hypothetical protein